MANQTENAKKMQDRANALADSLIEVFGYTDGQLVASLTMAAIGKRLVNGYLDGQYEADDEPGPNSLPIVLNKERGNSRKVTTMGSGRGPAKTY